MSPIHWLWLGALALMLLCLLVLLPPLLAAGEPCSEPGRDSDSEAALRRLYRSQLDDLAAQRQSGQLDAQHHEQAVEELQQRLLQELDRRGGATAAPQAWPLRLNWQRGSALMISLALPLAAFALYQRVGDPRAAAEMSAQAMAQSQGHDDGSNHAPAGPQVEAMVAGLAQRLAEQPEDLGGWLMLARSYETLERFDAAAQAYRQALAQAQRSGQEAQLRARLQADLADVLASAHGGDLEGEAGQAIAAALALHADQPKALALAGTAAWRRGDAAQARQHWQRLLVQLDPNSEMAQRVRDDLLRVEQAAPGAAGLPRAGAVAAASSTDGLRGRLLWRAQPGQVLPPQAVIYVVLRRAGQAQPLAVLRLPAQAGEQDFEIGPGQRLSPSQAWVDEGGLQLQARLSLTGQALAQPGDLSSAALAVRLGQGGLNLVLDVRDRTPTP